MQTILLLIHLLIVISLVTLIFLQQSTAGGLGFGGDKDFMAARGTKTALTRLTAIFATCFFISSLLLTVASNYSSSAKDVLKQLPASAPTSAPVASKPLTINMGGQKASPGASSQGNSKVIPITIPDSVLESIRKQKEQDKHKK